jgi:hypothetical protein
MGRDWSEAADEVLKDLESVSDIFLRTVESTTYLPVAENNHGGTGLN